MRKIARQVCRLILHSAHTQIMSAPHNQAGFTPDLHKSKPLRRASISVLILRQLFASMAPFSPKKRKKVPCVWCKIHLTLLSSTEISKNRVEKTRENKQNRPKFAPSQGFFGPFSCLFQPQVSRLMFARLGYFCRPQFPWLSSFPDLRPELYRVPYENAPAGTSASVTPGPSHSNLGAPWVAVFSASTWIACNPAFRPMAP